MEVNKMFKGKGGFKRKSFNLPKPVEVGKEYDVEISEVGAKGDGIARINNFVVFVPNTSKGEKVRVKINSIGRSFAIAEKVSGSG
jgi:predicted RNA-binding protein with TRAM domain